MNLHHELITPNLRTTSRVVAEKFGKMHKNVLRDIDCLKEDVPHEFWRLNFEPRDYLDSRGKYQPAYELTRDGFVLLTMGFTGKAAMEWKVRFIEAFNMMAAELAGSKLRSPDGDAPPVAVPPEAASWTISETLGYLAEMRRLFGDAVAAQKANLVLPPVLRGPNVSAAADPAFTVEDGRACLRHILAFQTGHGTVAEVFAGNNGPAGDAVRQLGLGLRWNSHMSVRHSIDPRLFQDTPWAGGWHRDALLTVPGAHDTNNRAHPALLVPLSGVTAAIIPLHPED